MGGIAGDENAPMTIAIHNRKTEGPNTGMNMLPMWPPSPAPQRQAAIGHVLELGPGSELEELHREVVECAAPRTAIVKPAGVRLWGLNESCG